MRKLILSLHISLDGFVAGPNGELNWVILDENIFDFVAKLTKEADTALYGRKTYQIMENYWPTAGDKPGASRHDKEHARWYNKVPRFVLSKTLDATGLTNTNIISDHIPENIIRLKKEPGKNILMFGSPSAAQTLLAHGLADELGLLVNPVLLGRGVPFFKDMAVSMKLALLESKIFSCGVVALHYGKP